MSSRRIPVPHPSVFIVAEMDARGWYRHRLALEMAGGNTTKEYGICRLALDLYLDVGPTDRNLRIDPEMFARGFGVSPELWTNLERAWLASLPPVGEG